MKLSIKLATVVPVHVKNEAVDSNGFHCGAVGKGGQSRNLE